MLLSPHTLRPGTVGLGFRTEIAGDLLSSPGNVDFLEVVAEACFANKTTRREAVAMSRAWPVVPHGVGLSLGSAEGVDVERARRLGALARELRAPVVTEHVAFVRAGGHEIGHLTQLPFTREAVRVVAHNVAVARRHLPDVPLLLENAAWTLRWPNDELDEATFYNEVVEKTGCGLLLDLGNLYANAVNAGVDPLSVLAAYPLERVGMVHLAGGALRDGFYFDTHAHAVPEAVFSLFSWLIERVGPVPTMLERDGAFPAFEELATEVSRARAFLAESSPRSRESANGRNERTTHASDHEGRGAVSSTGTPLPRALILSQAHLAALLTDVEPATSDPLYAFGEGAVARSREVLRGKRVDDALSLLSRLSPHRDALRPLAVRCLETSPRPRSHTAVTDAMRIARAAKEEAQFALEATVDLVLLRSRYVGPDVDGSVRSRVAPFVAREQICDGRRLWVFKGPGRHAATRLFDTGSV